MPVLSHDKVIHYTFGLCFQLSGSKSDLYIVRACLSRGKRIIPVIDPDRSMSPTQQTMYPDGGGRRDPGKPELNTDRILSRQEELERDEKLFCPGGRLLSLNVSGSERNPEFSRVLVPYPAAGIWFLTILPTCSRLYSFHGQTMDRPNM